jgi:chorismate mutase/prephenate dehydratase
MIRRLLERHEGALPGATVARIWRELVGAVSLLQTGLKISVTEGRSDFWEMARNYFGSVVAMQKSASPLHAIGSVRENESYFAVVPWPADNETNPWWLFLFNQEGAEKMKIVCALPYGTTEGDNVDLDARALVISKTDFISSGEDSSFIAFETDKGVSRARIIDVLKDAKLESLGLSTKTDAQRSFHLAEVDDYISENDPRLKQIATKLEGLLLRCAVLGGYPVPPLYKKVARPLVEKSRKTGTS